MQMNNFPIQHETKEYPAVSLQNVHFTYGIGRSKVEILKGINVNVDKGIIYGLLGPSGCGKTTLLKCLIANLKPKQGNIKVFGVTPGLSESKIPGSGVGYMPQELALYTELTIGEILAYFGRLHHMKSKDVESRVIFLLDFLDLPLKTKLIKNLSGGEQRRVSLTIALLHQPPLLILDEPTVGVDPVLRRSIWNYLAKLCSDDHVTVIITTHYVEEARQANKVALMRDGIILAEEDPCSLISHYEASNLEEVFFKLSEEQSSIVNSNNKNNDPIDSNVKKKSIIPKNYKQFRNQVSDCLELPSLTRISAITIVNFLKIWRNIILMLMQFMAPALQIAITFWTFGSELHDLDVAVLNQDLDFGLNYLHHINNHTVHQISVNSLQEGENLVLDGKAWGVVSILPNFTSALFNRFYSCDDVSNSTFNSSSIHVRYDNTNYQIADTLQLVFHKAFESFSADLLKAIGKSESLSNAPIKFYDPIYNKGMPTFIDFLAPGLLIAISFVCVLNMTAVGLIIEKINGLLQRNYVSGATSFEIMCGHILSQLGVVVIQLLIFLLVIFEGFNVKNEGSFLLLFLLCILQCFQAMTYGFLISVICNDETSAMLLIMATFYPLYMCCGALKSLSSLPNFLQDISHFLPLTQAIISVRWILFHGRGITWTPVWLGFISTSAWALVFIILSKICMQIQK